MDKVAIGLTPNNDHFVGQLVESGLFRHEMDAAKLALSIAISRRCALGDTQGAGTKWNVGSFDKDGQLKRLMSVLYPRMEDPYRSIEFFINAGLKIMAETCRNGVNLDVRRIMDLSKDSGESKGPATKG